MYVVIGRPRAALLAILIGAGGATVLFCANADDSPGLHNLIPVSDRIYSGAEPVGDDSFARLAEMGIETIVSVDGAMPDVVAARAYGLRYVHIPIGYDGVAVEAQSAMAKVLEEQEGPVYVHCHHGKHRGPAMAAIAWRIDDEQIETESALALLERAKTSPDYAGLYDSVRRFDRARLDTAGITLHERVPVTSLAAEMAEISRIIERIELSARNAWAVPEGHDDISAEHEATMLAERLREVIRNGDIGEMEPAMRESERLAWKFRDVLRNGTNDAKDKTFRSVRRSCRDCHKIYRN